MAASKYVDFLRTKQDLGTGSGFDPIEIHEFLFPFQRTLVDWAIRRGRAAIFADCGMGKTPIQLSWADNVVRKANKPVLILTPLAVGQQTIREAEKFDIEAVRSRDGTAGRHITVTNYQQLARFRPDDFAGCVCDESSILKNFDGKTKAAVTEFMRTIPYRLLCTATAAPNDFIELGTSAEALGEMGFQDMLTRFFRQSTEKGRLGWGRAKYWLRSHAEHDFWRWICSWSRACRCPADLGFEDDRFTLPPIEYHEHVIEARRKRNGFLFDMPATTLQDQREERRRTIEERCEKIHNLTNHDRPVVVWCHLNDEGDRLEEIIDGSVQVSGFDSDESKENSLIAFASGEVRVLITKPQIAGYGLNWQHCAHMTFFPSHSFEQFYQGVRRCWRFGQKNPVRVDIVASEGEAGVQANLQRKADQAEVMFSSLVKLMNDHLSINRTNPFAQREDLPPWLSTIST